jgi:hypothetical protein
MKIIDRDTAINVLKNKLVELQDIKKKNKSELQRKEKINIHLKNVTKKYKDELIILRKSKKRQIEQIKGLLSYLDLAINDKNNDNNKSLLKGLRYQSKTLLKELDILNYDLEKIRDEIKTIHG